MLAPWSGGLMSRRGSPPTGELVALEDAAERSWRRSSGSPGVELQPLRVAHYGDGRRLLGPLLHHQVGRAGAGRPEEVAWSGW